MVKLKGTGARSDTLYHFHCPACVSDLTASAHDIRPQKCDCVTANFAARCVSKMTCKECQMCNLFHEHLSTELDDGLGRRIDIVAKRI